MNNLKKNVLDFEIILSRVKLFLKTDSDKVVALKIGMKPNAFYNRKAKGSIPLIEFVCLANTYNVSINWLVNGIEPIFNNEVPEEHHKNKKAEKNNFIAVDHYDMVKNFQDQTRAKQINRNLLKIEQHNKQAFRDIDNYIKGIVNGLKYSNQEQHLKNNDRDDPKKDGNSTAGNNMKKVNEG